MDFEFLCLGRWLTLVSLALSACSPALNWRQVSIAEAAVELQFPCKPERQVQAGLGLVHCEAAGMRFVLGWREWPEPSAAQRAVAQAAAEAGARMSATPVLDQGASLPADALSWAGTGRYRLDSPSGRVEMQVWARGLTAYQAYVIGPGRVQNEAAQVFLSSVRSRT
jgi:hypothetical protein